VLAQNGYIVGAPKYVPIGELALCRVISGNLPRPVYPDALAHSAKDNREHNFVVEAIAESLGRVCRDLEVGMVPDVAVFGPVAHLATPIRGRLTDPAPSALEVSPCTTSRSAAGRSLGRSAAVTART